MPVEIRELIIRAVVNDSHDQRQAQPEREHTAHNTDEIIEECVKQVVKILKKSQER